MADFAQAIEWMKEGKKVMRPYFKEFYFAMDKDKGILPQGMNYELKVYDYQAEDWEIYGEEDNWNMKDNLRDEYNPNKQLTDINGLITLKEKILDDIRSKDFVDGGFSLEDIEDIEEILDRRFGF